MSGRRRQSVRCSPLAGRALRNLSTTEPYDDGYSVLQKPAAICVSNKLAGGWPQASSAKFSSSRAAWAIVVCFPSASVRQNTVRSRDAVRIDDGQIVRRGHLHQAQLGPERILRHKLRVDADAIGAGEPPAEIGQLGGGGNRLVRHGKWNGATRIVSSSVRQRITNWSTGGQPSARDSHRQIT